jgi:hypothetical protein
MSDLHSGLLKHRGAWWYVRSPDGAWYFFDQRKGHAWSTNKNKARPMSMRRALELVEELSKSLVVDLVVVPANLAAEKAEADKEFVRAVFLAAGRTEPI